MQNLVIASENCQHYVNSQQLNSLTDPTVILGRIFAISMTLSTRPLIHPMKIWPKVAHHIVQVRVNYLYSFFFFGEISFFLIFKKIKRVTVNFRK